jgi:serine/threonine-protein kinase
MDRTMPVNPYAPPRVDVMLESDEPTVSDAVLKKIRNAWIAGLISTVVTLVFTLLAVAGKKIAGVTPWQFVDVAILIGLTFGIYRKSRTCATVMLVYFVISKIMLFAEGQRGGLVMAFVFFYFYAQGIQGTFAYHRHAKAAADSA